MKQWDWTLKMITNRNSMLNKPIYIYQWIIDSCFRIFDDNIEMQLCEPYELHNVSPSDTKATEQIYEQM